MREMLSRFEKQQAARQEEAEEGSDDEDNSQQTLAARLEGLDLAKEADVEKIWALLTPKEREEFTAAVSSGALTAALEPWQPWWQENSAAQPPSPIVHPVAGPAEKKESTAPLLVEESDAARSQPLGEPTTHAQTPAHPQAQAQGQERSVTRSTRPTHSGTPSPGDIPRLRNLLAPGKQPAPELMFNLIDLLLSYCFVQRCFNGELEENAEHVLATLAAVSPVIGCSAVHTSAECAVRAVRMSLYDNSQLTPLLAHFSVALSDLLTLLLSSSHVSRALHELHTIAIRASQVLRQTQPKSTKGKAGGSDVTSSPRATGRKLLFMCAWWRWIEEEGLPAGPAPPPKGVSGEEGSARDEATHVTQQTSTPTDTSANTLSSPPLSSHAATSDASHSDSSHTEPSTIPVALCLHLLRASVGAMCAAHEQERNAVAMEASRTRRVAAGPLVQML